MTRVVAFAVLACTLVACTLYYDLDGLSTTSGMAPRDADADIDVGVDVAVDLDADVDVNVHIDAATPVDAAVDADTDFCADKKDAALCDDFERSAVLGTWSSLASSLNGAMLSLDETRSSSPTRSLRAFMPATSQSGQALHYAIPQISKFIKIEFSMRFDDLPGTKDSGLSDDAQLVALYSSATDTSVFLFASANWGVRIAEQQGSSFRFSSVGYPPLGSFVRYVLTIDLANATFVATMGAGMPVVQNLTRSFGSDKTISLGVVYAGPQQSSREVWFDDVLVTLQ